MAKDKTSKGLIEQLRAIFTKNKTLVLDIGADKVKAADVLQKGDKITINALLEIENTEKYFNGKDITNYDGLVNDINRVIKITDLKAKKVDLVYNSTQLQTKIIKVPEMSEKDVKEFVEVEYHKSFANISPATHIMDYLPLGLLEEEDRVEHSILIATMPIIESTKILKAFELKQIEVNSIETNIHALGNALWMTNDETEHKIILHIGKEYSLILFSKNDIPMFYRMFPFGYEQLSRKLQEDLQTSLSNVDNVIKTLGFQLDESFKTDFDQVSYEYALNESFSNFMNEVYRSINYVKMQTKFESEKLYISGGVANMAGLKEFIEENIALKAEVWTFSDLEKDGKVISMKNKETVGPEYAPVLGLAIRGWM